MKTLKTEEVNGKAYASIEDARRQIGEFIETVYNASACTRRSATNPRSSSKPNCVRSRQPKPGRSPVTQLACLSGGVQGCSVQLCSRLGLACKRDGARGSRPACLALVCSHSPRHCHRAHGLASIDRARVLFANFLSQLEDGSMTIQDQPAVVLNDGRSMPQFGLGVFQTPPEITADIVRKAVDVGYRAVDTAAAYRNEEGVGEALDGRPDIFVTTKLWNADHGFDEALRAFEESARKLRRHALDLYLIHWPRPRVNRYVQSWKALVRLKSEGRSQLDRRIEFQSGAPRADHRRDGGHARGQSDRASSPVSAEGLAERFTTNMGSGRNPGARSVAGPC